MVAEPVVLEMARGQAAARGKVLVRKVEAKERVQMSKLTVLLKQHKEPALLPTKRRQRRMLKARKTGMRARPIAMARQQARAEERR